MAARKSAGKTPAKGASKEIRKKRPTASRKRIPRAKAARGPEPAESPLDAIDPSIAETVARVGKAGGSVAGAYRDPLSGTPLVAAILPLGSVEPTPFQRELSPTHVKRLAQKIDECGVFLDPIIAVASPGGGFWSPNGRHRLAAAKSLGMRSIAALISPDPRLAYRILALNTEKAHNLRDRSLEVIRMAREIAARDGRTKESDHGEEFEAAPFLTLGIIYEEEGRFAGGAYHPVLRRVDRFDPAATLRASLRQREGWASRLQAIDASVTKTVKALQARGFKSPYLRTFVVARINPVRWIKVKKGDTTPPMSVGEALTRMAKAIRDFKVESVKQSDLALVAAVAPEEGA
jgi:ParB family chromosome partitioning protein